MEGELMLFVRMGVYMKGGGVDQMIQLLNAYQTS